MGTNYNQTVIRKGSTGELVQKWQQYLISEGYKLEPDGDYGDFTEDCTKKWQKAKGLVDDGVVGPMTFGFAFDEDYDDGEVVKIRCERELLNWIKQNLGKYIQVAVKDKDYTESLLGAMACREVGFLIRRYVNKGMTFEEICENMRGDYNNQYHGFGFWQIDIRSFPEFIENVYWKDPQKTAIMAVSVLDGKDKYLRKYKLRIGAELYDRAVVAAYNCGEGNVEKAILRGYDIDHYTYNDDYSKEVFRMKKIYEDIEKHNI